MSNVLPLSPQLQYWLQFHYLRNYKFHLMKLSDPWGRYLRVWKGVLINSWNTLEQMTKLSGSNFLKRTSCICFSSLVWGSMWANAVIMKVQSFHFWSDKPAPSINRLNTCENTIHLKTLIDTCLYLKVIHLSTYAHMIKISKQKTNWNWVADLPNWTLMNVQVHSFKRCHVFWLYHVQKQKILSLQNPNSNVTLLFLSLVSVQFLVHVKQIVIQYLNTLNSLTQ